MGTMTGSTWLTIFIIIGLAGFISSGCGAEKLNSRASNLDVRPDVKEYIDELYGFHLIHIGHTTDSISMGLAKRVPKDPQIFDAGRFKVLFKKADETKGIIVQTESVVGHYSKVVPGETELGGYIQLNADPNGEMANGPKLEPQEVDYFIRMLYSKFSVPLKEDEAKMLNKLKDMALAIMFNSKTEMNKYHLELIDEVVR